MTSNKILLDVRKSKECGQYGKNEGQQLERKKWKILKNFRRINKRLGIAGKSV